MNGNYYDPIRGQYTVPNRAMPLASRMPAQFGALGLARGPLGSAMVPQNIDTNNALQADMARWAYSYPPRYIAERHCNGGYDTMECVGPMGRLPVGFEYNFPTLRWPPR